MNLERKINKILANFNGIDRYSKSRSSYFILGA